MDRKIIMSMLAIVVSMVANAQLTVTSDGKVCVVKTSPIGNSLFSLGNSNIVNIGNVGINSQVRYSSTAGDKAVGIFGYANSATSNNAQTMGVMGFVSTGYNGKTYGVLGGIPSSKKGAGIYGTCGTSGSAFGKLLNDTYAGYFEGQTYVDGSLTATEVITPSDIRLKENIISVKDEEEKSGESTIENLMDMRVIKYTYKPKEYMAKTEEELALYDDEESAVDAERIAKQEIRRMAAQKHYGLSAQELQKIYPDLVRESQDGTLGVNYVELVPILIRSIQELKQELDELKSDNGSVKQTRSAFSDDEDGFSSPATKNILYQNTPNPFKEQTTIRFSLADDVTSAAICIFDMSGKMLKNLPVSSGDGSVTVNGWELGEGRNLERECSSTH